MLVPAMLVVFTKVLLVDMVMLGAMMFLAIDVVSICSAAILSNRSAIKELALAYLFR